MRRRLRALALLTALAALLCACQNEAVTATPESPIPGFWSSGQQVAGGDASGELNLKAVNAAIQGSGTMISLSFVTGSIAAGGEEKPLNVTPEYSVEALEGPGRLLVRLKLGYSDYEGELPSPAGLFTGIYALPDPDGVTTRVYLQFTGKIGFQADEQKGALILRVEPENPDEFESYYATVPFDESTRDIAVNNGMHPVLCEDGENMLFISRPFADNAQADELSATVNRLLDAGGINHRAGVIATAGNWAPAYRAAISLEELNHLGALATPEGEVFTAAAWAVEARFLAWTPDGEGLCAHPVTRDEGGEVFIYEQFWVYGVDGSRQLFIDNDFAYIDRAAFSPDGRYLAFIERVEAKRLLYIYDTRDKKLDFLSSEGMGDLTASFDWSADNKLYALSGSGTMQLMRFDPATPSGGDAPRVTAVEERYGGAGSVHCAGNLVYINGDVEGKIFAVDPVTGDREEFADGGGFLISPDGKTMLIFFYEPEVGVDSQTGVKVRDMASGEETQLTSGMTYHAGCWSRDGALLSFLVSNYTQVDALGGDDDVIHLESGSGEDGDYPARLYAYDPARAEAVLVGRLASDSLYPGRTGSEVVLVAYHENDDGTLTPVTYRLELP